MRRNRYLDHLHHLFLPPSGEEEQTSLNLSEQEISRGRESPLKMGLLLLEYSLFIDVEGEPPRIQNFHHI